MRDFWRQLHLGRYAADERPALAGLLALVLLGVALDALAPWPVKLVTDHVLAGAPLPSWAAWLAGLPGAETRAGLLAWLAGALVLLLLAAQGVHLALAAVQAGLGSRLQVRLAADVFEHLQALSLAWHGRAEKGDLVRRVAVDTGCVPALLGGIAVPLVTGGLTLAVLFGVMWQLDAALAGVAIGVALPLAVLLRLLGPRMAERAYDQEQLEGKAWAVAEQTLTALPLVQAFGRELHEGQRFSGVSWRSLQARMRSVAAQLQFKLGVDGCLAVGGAAVMGVGGWRVLQGSATVGTLVVFLSYLAALYAPLVALAYLSSALAGATGSARRVLDVLAVRDRVDEAPDARPLREPAGPRGRVQIEGLVVGYEPGRPVLHGVDLQARPGEMVAIVGSTGAGKSTLVACLPRLLDPWQGRVLLDGQDLRSATLASVRERVALVLQDPFVLPLSVAENIAYGCPSASRAAIETAARAAHADEFIRRLPRGYDEVIGERGVTLSGGQRQRIAIARALLRDAAVLVLDEPTAALDAQTEAGVMAAIERAMQGRTTLVIAHRLSTVRRADRIVVLEAGRVVASGTHQELGSRCAAYQRLQATQLMAA
ncbi:MAG TPA: ABC transporter ATP-binding protein [Burkholderiaceae bacterium]|nr:ABC transporter ATP-binding protein [Burkholderiaceae bacterium]